MIIDRSLLRFDENDNVIYNDINLPINRHNLMDYSTNTGYNPESLIFYHYKLEMDKIRDKQLEINDRPK
jgi:hypothetical protein